MLKTFHVLTNMLCELKTMPANSKRLKKFKRKKEISLKFQKFYWRYHFKCYRKHQCLWNLD
ncbi:hypothetical protein [Caulobacter phage Cr30]|uniref:hypothetical protein n=1 Tax=Caulobacter phage Cr30 TaxID=1357714 RepID=UPI0004A9B9DD|nr:hypothetical protein OZ74_gp188 [Caulobacter phage Cr30]AGS81155.1 hypothetical protein [Caulobacter phage Cr30]